MCSPDIWHATLLRDPLDRIVSHHNHLWSTILRAKPRKHEKVRSLPDEYFRGVFNDDGSCIPAKELPYTMAAPHRTGYDWSMVCALSSDYHTRSLLGTSYSQRPYDGETEPLHSHEDMLDKAKRTLLDYAVVLTTDDASEALPIVRHALRWRPWSLNEVLPVRDRQSGRKRIRREAQFVINRSRVAHGEEPAGHCSMDSRGPWSGRRVVLFCGGRGRVIQEDVRDPKRAFCGGGGELERSHVVKPGSLSRVTPDAVVGFGGGGGRLGLANPFVILSAARVFAKVGAVAYHGPAAPPIEARSSTPS